MGDDICDRLMRFAGKVCLSTDTEVEAADEIERLRAENEKLRAALKPFADNYDVPRDGDIDMTEAYRAAAAALKEMGDE